MELLVVVLLLLLLLLLPLLWLPKCVDRLG
jgi:hypothetical protein